jgi:hypothetical protein
VRFHERFRPGSRGLLARPCDALVWALTELLVEPLKNSAFYEVMRQRVEEMRQKAQPEPPKREYSIGSVEWQLQQQQQCGGER